MKSARTGRQLLPHQAAVGFHKYRPQPVIILTGTSRKGPPIFDSVALRVSGLRLLNINWLGCLGFGVSIVGPPSYSRSPAIMVVAALGFRVFLFRA